MIETAKHSK